MLFKLLLGIIVLSPLPFGSNREWAWSLLCILIALIGISWSVSGMWGGQRRSYRQLNHLKWPIVLYCLPLLWALIQVIPNIGSQVVNPVWALTSNALNIQLPGFISTSPYDTLTAFMRLLSYGLVFLVSAWYCREDKNAKLLYKWIAFAGFCYASYSLIIYFGGYRKILWYDDVYMGVSGTFINPNNYVTYAGLGILCCMPKLFGTIKESTQFGFKSNYGKQYFIEQLLTQGWFVIIELIIMMTALLLTQSRSGCFSTLVALLSLFGLLSLRKHNQERTFSFAICGLFVFFFAVFQISGNKLLVKLNELDVSMNGRLAIFKNIIKGINDNPWLGTGYGTFENSFKLFRDESVTFHIKFGHNTYLENIFELGLPQAILLFTSVALAALRCLNGVSERKRNVLYPAIGFSGTLLVSTHALTDFSLQIPAVAVTYAAILGAGYAQSFSFRHQF